MARETVHVRGKWRYVNELGYPEWAQQFVPVQDRQKEEGHGRG